MHGKKAAFAVAALAASQANAFNTYRHKHVERGAIDVVAHAREERAILEERHRYAHTETVTTTLTVTEYVTEGDEAVAAPTAVFFETSEASSPAEEAATPTSDAEVGSEEETIETPAAAIVVDEEVEATSTAVTAAATSSAVTGATSSCKRGVAYSNSAIGQEFASSNAICWGQNWGSIDDLGDAAVFVPTMWGPKNNLVDDFVTNTQALIDAGKAEAVLSLNEPDHYMGDDVSADGQQSYYWLTKDESGTINSAVSLHKEVMSQFAGKVLVGSPGVTSDYGANGKSCDITADGCDDEAYTDLASAKSVTWLKEFKSRCGDDCPLDFVNVHYYATDGVCGIDNFKMFIGLVQDAVPDLPIWVTEFQALCDDSTNSNFLQNAMEWMDSDDSPVARYAYYKADDMATLKTLYLSS